MPPTGDYEMWHKSIGSRWRKKATGLVVELRGANVCWPEPNGAAVVMLYHGIPLAMGIESMPADEFCRAFEPESSVDEAIAQRCGVGSVKA